LATSTSIWTALAQFSHALYLPTYYSKHSRCQAE
jgi:hypothetical protein